VRCPASSNAGGAKLASADGSVVLRGLGLCSRAADSVEYWTVRTDQLTLLSGQLGRPVVSSDGAQVGRVVDVTVLYDLPHPAVHRFGVGRGRRIRHLIPQRLVGARDDRQVSVGAMAAFYRMSARALVPASTSPCRIRCAASGSSRTGVWAESPNT
jgi:hypothetical protein